MMQRILAVIRKELIETKRDKGFLLLLILQPIIVMSIFSFAFQGEIQDLPTAVINFDDSNFADDVISAISSSDYFEIAFSGNSPQDLNTAMKMLNRSEIRAIIAIPTGFGTKLDNSETVEIVTHIDSSDYLIYNTLRAASSEILKEASKDITGDIVQKIELEKAQEEQKIESARTQVEGISTAITQAKSKVTQEHAKVQNITKDVDSILTEVDEVYTLIKDAEDELEGNEEILDSASTKLNSLDTDLATLIANLEALSETNPDLNPIIADLEDMQDELDDLQYDLEDIDANADIDEARAKTASTKEKAQNIKNKVNSIDVSEQALIGDIESKYTSAKSTVDSISFELTGLNSAFLSSPANIEQDLLFGKIRYLDYLTPAVISMILFFIYLFITTINIVQERTRGTLYRTATTPLRKFEMFGGKFLAFSAIGVLESVYVLFTATYVFGAINHGSVLAALLIELLLIMPSPGIGLMVSTLIKTERQALAALPLISIPSILISQTFAPIEVMPEFIRPLAYLSPMTYSTSALRAIMIKGESILAVWPQITILMLYGIAALTIGIMLYKKRLE